MTWEEITAWAEQNIAIILIVAAVAAYLLYAQLKRMKQKRTTAKQDAERLEAEKKKSGECNIMPAELPPVNKEGALKILQNKYNILVKRREEVSKELIQTDGDIEKIRIEYNNVKAKWDVENTIYKR